MLYRVVAEHLETLLAEARDRSAHGVGYPRFIEDTFRRYLTCGILAFGFGRVRCETCGDQDLVAFSCKGRGLCPSCQARRMAATAATLVDEVLPVARYRQWTLSVPWQLRLLLATRPALVSWVLGVFVRKVFAWQRLVARDLLRTEDSDDAADPPRGSRARPEPGAITSLQRFGSKINLHCHYHTVVADAVWVRAADGSTRTVTVPAPDDDDVRAIVTAIARRVRARLARADAAASEHDADDASDDDHLLAQTALLASLPLVSSAPTTRAPKARARCALALGFSFDANVAAEPGGPKRARAAPELWRTTSLRPRPPRVHRHRQGVLPPAPAVAHRPDPRRLAARRRSPSHRRAHPASAPTPRARPRRLRPRRQGSPRHSRPRAAAHRRSHHRRRYHRGPHPAPV